MAMYVLHNNTHGNHDIYDRYKRGMNILGSGPSNPSKLSRGCFPNHTTSIASWVGHHKASIKIDLRDTLSTLEFGSTEARSYQPVDFLMSSAPIATILFLFGIYRSRAIRSLPPDRPCKHARGVTPDTEENEFVCSTNLQKRITLLFSICCLCNTTEVKQCKILIW